jgi:hypothetical protein
MHADVRRYRRRRDQGPFLRAFLLTISRIVGRSEYCRMSVYDRDDRLQQWPFGTLVGTGRRLKGASTGGKALR